MTFAKGMESVKFPDGCARIEVFVAESYTNRQRHVKKGREDLAIGRKLT